MRTPCRRPPSPFHGKLALASMFCNFSLDHLLLDSITSYPINIKIILLFWLQIWFHPKFPAISVLFNVYIFLISFCSFVHSCCDISIFMNFVLTLLPKDCWFINDYYSLYHFELLFYCMWTILLGFYYVFYVLSVWSPPEPLMLLHQHFCSATTSVSTKEHRCLSVRTPGS